MQTRDFQSMQSQAIDFARQMYEKSGQNRSDNTKQSNGFRSESKRSFNPNQQHTNNLFSFSGNCKQGSDNDISLILALIILLSKDSGDNILLLALLYIMS